MEKSKNLCWYFLVLGGIVILVSISQPSWDWIVNILAGLIIVLLSLFICQTKEVIEELKEVPGKSEAPMSEPAMPESSDEPMEEPAPEMKPESSSEPVSQPMSEPAAQPANEPMSAPTPEPSMSEQKPEENAQTY